MRLGFKRQSQLRRLSGPARLLVLALLGSGLFDIQVSSAESPQKIALLVGVADYFDKNMEDLSYAENDVVAVGKELQSMGFESQVLIGKDATREKVDAALNDLLVRSETLESDAIVFLMFSGHGQELKTTETDAVSGATRVAETPFFCPRDAVPFDPIQHSLRDKDAQQVAEELNLVSLNRVINELDRHSNSRQNLLVVDACRNNPAKGKSAGITGSSAVNLPRGLSILFAATSGQKSWESADTTVKHGVMTHYLLQGLRGDAANNRSQITWSRLVSHVREEVEFDAGKLAGGADRRQTPHMIANDDSVIVLGEANFAGLQDQDWLQDPKELKKQFGWEPKTTYVIEFWPPAKDDTALAEMTNSINVTSRLADIETFRHCVVYCSSPPRSEIQLNANAALLMDPKQVLLKRHLPQVRDLTEPQVLVIDGVNDEVWRGTLGEFYLKSGIEMLGFYSDYSRSVAAIASRPPPLRATEWFTGDHSDLTKEVEFKPGQVTVVEFWAYWCGPCIPAMVTMSRLQVKHKNDSVRMISMGVHQTSDNVSKFLDSPYPDSQPYHLSPHPATFRQAFSNYLIATNDERISGEDLGETWMGHMGTSAIPFCVVIGKTGLIEWFGHTSHLERPLQQTVDGTWDREVFRNELFNFAPASHLSEQRSSELLSRYGYLTDYFDDERRGRTATMQSYVASRIPTTQDKEQREQLIQLRYLLSMQLGEIDDDCHKFLCDYVRDLQVQKDHDAIVNLIVRELPILNPESPTSKQLLECCLTALNAVSHEVPRYRKYLAYQSLAELQMQLGDQDTAGKAIKACIDSAPESQKESLNKHFADLREKLHN